MPSNELGNAFRGRGRLQEALAAYHRALPGALARGEPAPLGNIAATLSELGRFDEARTQLSRLVSYRPDIPAYRRELALANLRLLRLDEAEVQVAESLRLLPDYGDALALSERMRGRVDGPRKRFACPSGPAPTAPEPAPAPTPSRKASQR